MTEQPIVSVDNLTVDYPVGRIGMWRGPQRFARAVEDLSLDLAEGETLGLVGESGSGKTTAGRAIIRRLTPSGGTIHFRGQDITAIKGEELRRLRKHMQMVFQDPYGSLSPRMSVLDIVAEPLIVHGIAKDRRAAEGRVRELLGLTGLPPDAVYRHPHAFSGGQRQRIGIARALAANPSFVVVDEPVAALDTSIQAQVVNLLQDIQQKLGLTYLFIAHDLSVVRHISSRVAIMYAGRLMERADRDAIYDAPLHPYTKSLLSAVPIPDPELQARRERIVIPGEVPDPTSPPPGCRFQTRCPYRQAERCADEVPPLYDAGAGHGVACHWWTQIADGSIRPRVVHGAAALAADIA